MIRGDVVRVDLPSPSGQPGREQIGHRPAIVVQVGGKSANLTTVVVVPLTSNLQSAKFPGGFILEPCSSNGLDVRSVVLTAQIRAIDVRRVTDVIGHLSDGELTDLENNLRSILGL